MASSGRFVYGALIGLIGLLGLFLAAGAKEGHFYAAGLFLAGFSLAMIFWLIKRSWDQHDRALGGH
jgi:uncharacterized membrane protein